MDLVDLLLGHAIDAARSNQPVTHPVAGQRVRLYAKRVCGTLTGTSRPHGHTGEPLHAVHWDTGPVSHWGEAFLFLPESDVANDPRCIPTYDANGTPTQMVREGDGEGMRVYRVELVPPPAGGPTR